MIDLKDALGVTTVRARLAKPICGIIVNFCEVLLI
jgi:hypothetical protein